MDILNELQQSSLVFPVCIWSPGSDSERDRLQSGSSAAIPHLPQTWRAIRGPQCHVCPFPAKIADDRGRAVCQHRLLQALTTGQSWRFFFSLLCTVIQMIRGLRCYPDPKYDQVYCLKRLISKWNGLKILCTVNAINTPLECWLNKTWIMYTTIKKSGGQ